MSAYELGVLMGALVMVGILTFIATRLLRGTAASRVIGAVVGIAILGSVVSDQGCRDKRRAAAMERGFVQGCERTCRVENGEAADECNSYCRCMVQQERARRGDAEFVAWFEKEPDPAGVLEMRAQAVPACGRKLVRRQFAANCEKGCASGAECPPGLCECMAEAIVTDARFSDPAWVKAVVLAEAETPESVAWANESFDKCAAAQGEAPAAPPAAESPPVEK